VHPDGSFGGLYGSRCTRFYYPAGILALANEVPEAAALADFMASSISRRGVVNLSAIDEPNLVPMFNAYAWAASLQKEMERSTLNSFPSGGKVPCISDEPFRVNFPQAGLLIDRGINHYSVINVLKGGVVYHFREGTLALIDAGVVIRDQKGRYGSTQALNPTNFVNQQGNQLEIKAQITAMPKQLAGPLQFLALRILCLTAFRSVWVREWIKCRLVKLLITRRTDWFIFNQRKISLGETLRVQDLSELPAGYQRIENTNAFVAIHMASQGYWQIQDEVPKT
jgi:hypothetical protein